LFENNWIRTKEMTELNMTIHSKPMMSVKERPDFSMSSKKNLTLSKEEYTC
jgi:hypothetical protein